LVYALLAFLLFKTEFGNLKIIWYVCEIFNNFFDLPIEKYAEICYNIKGKIWEAEKCGKTAFKAPK